MPRRILLLTWCVLMCTSTSARAHQVQLGFEQTLDYQSNVLKNSLDPTADGTYRVRPTIRLSQPESDLTYDFEYRPSYTAYFRTSGIDGFDHLLNGWADYQFSARDKVRFSTAFSRLRAIRSDAFTDVAGQPFVVPSILGTSQRFEADLSFDHGFSSRTVGTVALDYNRWDYTTPNNVNNQGFGARVQGTHAVLTRLVIGANVEARYRAFEETSFAPASYSTVLNTNLLARYEIMESLTLEASGGPAGVFTRQSVPSPRFTSRWSPVTTPSANCTVVPCGRFWGTNPAVGPFCSSSLGSEVLRTCLLVPAAGFLSGRELEQVLVPLDPSQNVFGRSVDALTYFVSLSVVKRFRQGSLILSFVRNEDAGTGVGTTTILNSVSGRVTYAISDLWRVTATGVYTFRESVANLPLTDVSARQSTDPAAVDDFFGQPLAEANTLIAGSALANFDQSIGTADVALVRRLSEHSTLQFRFRYFNQSESRGIVTTNTGFDNFIGGVTWVYEFDPYKL